MPSPEKAIHAPEPNRSPPEAYAAGLGVTSMIQKAGGPSIRSSAPSKASRGRPTMMALTYMVRVLPNGIVRLHDVHVESAKRPMDAAEAELPHSVMVKVTKKTLRTSEDLINGLPYTRRDAAAFDGIILLHSEGRGR